MQQNGAQIAHDDEPDDTLASDGLLYSELGNIAAVAGIERVTKPTLDLLAVLLEANRGNREVHGWELMKAVHRPGPTVYGVIDRLEDAALIEGRWQEQAPSDKGPRRRYYRLTEAGVTTAARLLAERGRLVDHP